MRSILFIFRLDSGLVRPTRVELDSSSLRTIALPRVKINVLKHYISIEGKCIHQRAGQVGDVNEALARRLACSRVFDINQPWTEIENADVSPGLAHVVAQRFRITQQTKLRGAIGRHISITMLAGLR